MSIINITEITTTDAMIKYMAMPLLVSVCVVLFFCIATNITKVSLLRKWVANVNTNSPSESLTEAEEGLSEEDEDMQRIASIYRDM